MTDKVLSPPPHVEPEVFTRDQLDWLPWLEPMAEQDLTARHMAGLVDAARAKSAYFRLLARDPEVLIYNAFVIGPEGVTDVPAQAVVDCLSINAVGGLLCVQQVLPDMRRRRKDLVGHAGLAFRTRNPATTLIW